MKNSNKIQNVVFFSRLFYPHIGGVEKHVMRIAQELIKEGRSVTVVTEQYDRKLPMRENYDGISIIRIPIKGSERTKKMGIWLWMVKNISFLRSFDILHVHDVAFWVFPIAPFLRKERLFITFHGYESFPVIYRRKVLRRISVHLFSGVITVGDYLKKWYGVQSNLVIYGGVDEAAQARRLKKNEETPLHIVLIGRLAEDIGIKNYINALRELKNQKFVFTFEACGDGLFRKSLRKFGKIHGFVSNLTPYIERADIVFASSYLSILEALIHRKRVIAVYDNELKRDYLINAPFSKYISVCKTPEEIVAQVQRGVSDEKTVLMGYNWARKQSWNHISDLYLKLWQSSA